MANKLSSLDPKIIFDSFAGRIKTVLIIIQLYLKMEVNAL